MIGAAIEVHKALGPGYEPGVYATALMHELSELAVNFAQDAKVEVSYKGKVLGIAVADLFVENRFLVSVMARPGAISTYERLALRALLKAADLELGLIINFGERRLKDGLVRVVNIEKITKEKGYELDHDDEHGGDHGGEIAGEEGGSVHDFDGR